ncbi:hypothetical protein LDO26_11500 [Luteimonas sp. BDR2-5]|uniref:hypothetical protein n=1 Tax=Proluteimonas luteida TaxID=2878685 RepID=UPI001E61665B|nr:hypothetical protein [Luteimonas sp. BDR2-5]MCD9028831.1 hypothetical protein [Luteimonas sp. BDR2-5]
MGNMNAMLSGLAGLRFRDIAAALALLCPLSAFAGDAGRQDAPAVPAPDLAVEAADEAPWLQPIRRDTPIGSMASLRAEYRRIVELRRAQLEPEYERRLADEGQASADAWRDQTLREVVRRDRRDLKARVSR